MYSASANQQVSTFPDDTVTVTRTLRCDSNTEAELSCTSLNQSEYWDNYQNY